MNRLQPRPNQLANLKKLSLSSVKDSIDEAFCRLCRAGMFDRLEVLDVSWTNIRNTPLECLAAT